MNQSKNFLIIAFLLASSQFLFANEWYSAPSLNVPRGGAAAVTYGNYIYVFGGKSINNSVLNSVERFDLTTEVWDTTVVEEFEYPRYNAAAVVYNNLIYLMGGQNDETSLETVEVYDPVLNEWSEVSNLRREREALAGAVLNERIYVIGGQEDDQSLINEIEWYDQPSDDWLDAEFDLPYPRSAHFHGVLANVFYMFGGFYFGPTRTSYKAVQADSGYEWIQLDDVNIGRAYGAAAISREDIYLIGGETRSGKTSTVEVFLSDTESYGFIEPITSPRSGLAAVTVDDSIIYVIGGFESEFNDPVSKVEWYNNGLLTSTDRVLNEINPSVNVHINGYPNPFNNRISLEISIPENDIYVVEIFDITGQKIHSILKGNMKKGIHMHNWSADANISSGIYFVTVKSKKYFQKIKLVYVK